MIRRLHHNAYRCRDSEQTRRFYEDFLGLRLAGTLEINETKSGRSTETLHTFYELGDGSYLAFFEAPDMPFEFKPQHDYDLHIALEVDKPALEQMFARGKAAGVETRGVIESELVTVYDYTFTGQREVASIEGVAASEYVGMSISAPAEGRTKIKPWRSPLARRRRQSSSRAKPVNPSAQGCPTRRPSSSYVQPW